MMRSAPVKPSPAPALTGPSWTADRRATLVLALMVWVMLVSLTVPWYIFEPPTAAIETYQVNQAARLIKLALLFSGVCICLWRSALLVLLVKQLNIGLVAFLILVPLSYA